MCREKWNRAFMADWWRHCNKVTLFYLPPEAVLSMIVGTWSRERCDGSAPARHREHLHPLVPPVHTHLKNIIFLVLGTSQPASQRVRHIDYEVLHCRSFAASGRSVAVVMVVQTTKTTTTKQKTCHIFLTPFPRALIWSWSSCHYHDSHSLPRLLLLQQKIFISFYTTFFWYLWEKYVLPHTSASHAIPCHVWDRAPNSVNAASEERC